MTRVGILSEPASLRRAVESSLEREGDFQIVPALVSEGEGLVGPEVLVVSVDPAMTGRAHELGLAWNAHRSPRVVLMDVSAVARPAASGTDVTLTRASRRELARAVRAVSRSRQPWVPRVKPRLEGERRGATVTPLRPRRSTGPVLEPASHPAWASRIAVR